jgi:hypothetical protein
MKARLLATLCVICGLAGLARSQDKSPAAVPAKAATTTGAVPAGKSEERATLRVIGYLEKRDRVITIKSSPKGVVYSVAGRDGKVLFENLSLEQLKARAPEIHDFLKTGVGASAGPRLGKLDARF